MNWFVKIVGVVVVCLLISSCSEAPIKISLESPNEDGRFIGDTVKIRATITKEEDLINNVNVRIFPTNNPQLTIWERGRLVNAYETFSLNWDYIIVPGNQGQDWTLELSAWDNGAYDEPVSQSVTFYVN